MMLNITKHQGNANQNYNEISPHTCQNVYCKKKQQMKNIGEKVEKRKPSSSVGGNVNWCSHYENSMEVPKKLKIFIIAKTWEQQPKTPSTTNE